MDSPFPGMDPYLERYWHPVHTQIVGASSRALNRVLPPDLVARPEERLGIEADDELGVPLYRRPVEPDTHVFEPEPSDTPAAGTLTAPFKLVLAGEPVTERFVRVLKTDGERLVTVIEFVSPTNKVGTGTDAFVAKRNEMLDAGVNWVEIDLVRQGNWRRLLAPFACPARAVAEYRATVRLPGEPTALYMYPLPLRERLRPIPIPLRAGDAEVTLDVQRLLSDTYAEDRYGRTIDYARDPDPPFSSADAAWADELLRAAGRR